MILGRNAGLWVALVVAALNVLVVVFGVHLDSEQLAVLNAFALAIIGVIANEADPTSVGTFAPTTRATRPSTTTSSTGTGS